MRATSSATVMGGPIGPWTPSARTQRTRELFAPLGPTYDRYARLLSFGQDPRWRSFLVSRIPPDASRILDVASGTAAVAIELARAEPGRTITASIRATRCSPRDGSAWSAPD
jgi:ubiquinone/menaquinone biosynthesis C-methylase UbiE